MKKIFPVLVSIMLLACAKTSEQKQDRTVARVMDDVITRLYAQVPPGQYDSIDESFILDFLTDDEKEILSTRYQYFTVNVPVTVSLMHHRDQSILPFWLKDSGFTKTGRVVKNDEGYEYEVWQKDFPAGEVELGINGFDKHRPVYFITAAPQDATQELQITGVYPSRYPITTMKAGAFVYHDWSDLVFTEVPDNLVGQKLFTTVRGRAREAHVKNAFRKTPFPSSGEPDQIMLTWSASPKTSVDIQWRTHTGVPDGLVQYWKEGKADTSIVAAVQQTVQDRMLFNDRYMHRYTARLTGLSPGTRYGYRAGSKEKRIWSAAHSFTTEPLQTDKFSFVWFGDTHCFPDSGKLVTGAAKNNKDAAFYSITGDIVSTGLNRDDWDKLFHYAGDAFAGTPLMPVPGNHDRQDGLGAQLYYDLFSLPMNGPEKVEAESSYYFEYGNALFIMIDATSEVADHTAWMEKALSGSRATWKFVMFHFPPYNFEEPYPDIQQAWVPLFDQYHVDMVMSGHIHYYMRSKPMNHGNVVDDFHKGTVYAISVGIPGNHDTIGEESYAVKRYAEGYFYQRMEIDGTNLKYQAISSDGTVKDEFVIRK